MRKMLFLPAAGIPSRVYSRFFAELENDFEVIFPELSGASNQYPPDSEWQSITAEAEASLPEGDIVLCGHSMGAMVAFFLADKHRDRIQRLVMLDPALVTGFSKHLARLLLFTGQEDRMFPSGSTLKRRTGWPSTSEVRQYLRTKPFYSGWHEDCLEDFIRYGTHEEAGLRKLVFPVEMENEIYRTTPLGADRVAPLQLKKGVAVTGEKSPLSRLPGSRKFFRKHGMDHCQVPGGHMFPLEKPVETAGLVLSLLDDEC